MQAANLLTPLPAWASTAAPEDDCAVLTQLTLVRNLSDFPFPERCTVEERQSVEDRVLGALESVNLLSTGEYLRIRGLDAVTARVLAERRLLTTELLNAKGPAGLFVGPDQGISIMVNSVGHLCLRVIAPGLQLDEAWRRLSAMDDALGSVLDFAWDERLGFLTSDIGRIGTGLKAGLLLHLPATSWNNQSAAAKQAAAERRLVLEGIRPGPLAEGRPSRRLTIGGITVEQVRDQALFTDFDGAITTPGGAPTGDLYLLVNRGTLGEAEEEILFHLRHTAMELVAAERESREGMRANALITLEDRVGRAHGVASGARLLGFAEALALLSTLRLGAATDLFADRPGNMTDLLLRAQAGHLQAVKGQQLDGLNLTMDRAELFRKRFGAAR